MKIMKSTNIELSMLQQIEDHMKTHNISFAEFIRKAAAYYLDHNQNVTEVSIQDSELTEQPIETTPKTDNDFNFDDLNIK